MGHQCKCKEVSVLLVDEEDSEQDRGSGEFQAIEMRREKMKF